MENLKALVYKGDLTPYQRTLAQREFEGMIERLEIYEKAVKDNPYEVIKIIEAHNLNFGLGNVIKYISRAGKKGDALQDLEKAKW